MNEIVELMNEYVAIDDKDSLYARVLKSLIVACETRLRRELDRQAEAPTIDGERLTQM